jgi:hypothetical protein
MQLIYTIPLLLLFILILVPCLIVGLAGVWLVRRYDLMLDPEDNGTAALAHAFVGVLYAVALGLMVVGVQSGYTEVEMIVMKEAYLAGDLYLDSEGLSEQGGLEIQELTKQYVDAVIEKEWPAISAGNLVEQQTRSIQETRSIIDRLSHAIITYEAESNRDLVVYAELLSGVNDLLVQRRERLHLGVDGVGVVTWMVVVMGALITIGMAWFYNTRGTRAHYGLVASMSLMFGLMIFLIIAMDHPLWGKFSVTSEPFKEVQGKITEWEKEFDIKRGQARVHFEQVNQSSWSEPN